MRPILDQTRQAGLASCLVSVGGRGGAETFYATVRREQSILESVFKCRLTTGVRVVVSLGWRRLRTHTHHMDQLSNAFRRTMELLEGPECQGYDFEAGIVKTADP